MRIIPERSQIVHVWQNWDNDSVEELSVIPPIIKRNSIEMELSSWRSHYRLSKVLWMLIEIYPLGRSSLEASKDWRAAMEKIM